MRRDRVVALLHGRAGLDCPTPDGAFYAYVSCTTQIGKTTPGGKLIKDDSDFVMYLLDDFKVVTVRGAAYGVSPAFRISFATSMDVMEKACISELTLSTRHRPSLLSKVACRKFPPPLPVTWVSYCKRQSAFPIASRRIEVVLLLVVLRVR